MMRRTPMKRTGFRRHDGPRHIADILVDAVSDQRLMERPLPVARPGFRLPVPVQWSGHQAPKLEPLRSEQYRRYVASFPCMRCGLAGSSQCAHANKGKGMAMKVCDRRTFPLCFRCHSDIDNSRGMTREQRRALEDEYVELMQEIARRDNRHEFR